MTPTAPGPAKGVKKTAGAAAVAKATSTPKTGAAKPAAKAATPTKATSAKAASAKPVGKAPGAPSAAKADAPQKPVGKKGPAKEAADGAEATQQRPEIARPPLPPPTAKGTREWASPKFGNQPPRAGSHHRLRSSRGR